jgi:hypothetical protein
MERRIANLSESINYIMIGYLERELCCFEKAPTFLVQHSSQVVRFFFSSLYLRLFLLVLLARVGK